MSLIAACFVVMFRFAEPVLEKSKKDVQPTYVVLSPYAYRNNKTVKFIEKTAFGVGKLALPQCACKSLVAIVCVSPSSGRCPSCASTTVVPRPDPFPIFSSPRLVRIYLPRSNPSCVPAPVPSPVRLATTAAAATTSTKRVDPEADRRSAAMNEAAAMTATPTVETAMMTVVVVEAVMSAVEVAPKMAVKTRAPATVSASSA
uniref:RRM domain-containing protein n=1 Tax=Panagrellus redivivus TaxID=6233 RepID=A0A7E4UPF8_PANRE